MKLRLFRRRDNRYSRRLERRRLQLRAWWQGRSLQLVQDNLGNMAGGPIVVSTMRNEAVRLPFFLDYYRRLGAVHFLIVDNGSTDGTAEVLAKAEDVSLWRTEASYRASNFGVDWVNHLLARYGAGRWILCVDPDEFLVYPHCDTRDLGALTRWLDQNRRPSLGTLMLDMYGEGPASQTTYGAGDDPLDTAPWFDAGNYVAERHNRYHNLWIQGGPRQRVIFADDPFGAPALNKTPLVKWRKGAVFVTSTHNLLPRSLNENYSRGQGAITSGALLHFKFLETLSGKVAEELTRRQHYLGGLEYRGYAERGVEQSFWTPNSTRYTGWRQLVELGVIARGGWF
ncbi:glycosyltransferase family 2 protein [Rhodobacteraceae bacterium NNCM2]|nr:glycosyltransferase family 2 protein [Coraliihabitans acroporae]